MKKMYSNPVCEETELVSVAMVANVSAGGNGPQFNNGGNVDNIVPGMNPVPVPR